MDAGHHLSNYSSADRRWMRSLSFGVLLALVIYAVLVVFWPAPPMTCVAESVVRLRAASSAVKLPALSADELALLCGTQPTGPVRLETTANASGIRIRLVATAC